MEIQQQADGHQHRQRANPAGLTQIVVAHVYGVPMDELRAGRARDARTSLARQVAMYLVHITYGISLTDVARAFGRDRSTASHACHHIEDLRDDPGLDRNLDRLEVLLREATEIEISL